MRSIELLAPARDLECGLAAINHGADAVYIGAPQFGARAAAGNSLEDIGQLVRHAHLFGARVHVALNTILYDSELEACRRLVWQLYEIGVDALIVQDMALLQMDLPPIALHASTQMDNRTPEQVSFLASQGLEQVVLARELSLEDIRRIHEATPVALECFVHGALCVCYSGQCYISQHAFGRSANRGECAQVCRQAFDLVDETGQVFGRGKYFLSLRDMNRSAHLEPLVEAGISSFKIEGRLKNASYVKNITAYYRRQIDALIGRHPDRYQKASSGTTSLFFDPNPEKTFNRGFTAYFLHGRTPDVYNFQTPKSLGEPVGVVKDVKRYGFTVAGIASFSNGDGLCYYDSEGRLQGLRINKVENNYLYPQTMPQDLHPRTPLYRNVDQSFEKLLSRETAQRLIAVSWQVDETSHGLTFTLRDEDGLEVQETLQMEKELARTPQYENLQRQLGKLGGTCFQMTDCLLRLADDWFIASSTLAAVRRLLVDALVAKRLEHFDPRRSSHARRVASVADKAPFPVPQTKLGPAPHQTLTYLANVANREALTFYHHHGFRAADPALECSSRLAGKKGFGMDPLLVMTCRHCIRYAMGWCTRHENPTPFYPSSLRPSKSQVLPKGALYLVSADGRRWRLQFDCAQCQMKVYAS